MKNRVARILSLGIALVAAGAVYAQSGPTKANVPFDFYVGPTLMHQGEYLITENPGGSMTWVRCPEENATKAVITSGILSPMREVPAHLTFHRYGEDYFLTEIWAGQTNMGKLLMRSAREKELARGGTLRTLAVIRIALHR
jgi:hypothetical protein